MPRSAYEPIPLADTSRLTFPERLEYQKLGIMADELPTIVLNNRMEKTEYSSVLGLFLEKAARRSKEELDASVAKRLSEHPEREPTFPELYLFGADRRPVVNVDEDFSLTTACGYTLKRVIAKYLSCRLGAPIYSVPLILQHPHFPYLLAKLDFVAVFPDPETGELSQMVNVQCHTATYWKLTELQNKMPMEHELRCRQEMAVANLDESIVVYLCDNNEGGVVTYRVSRDYTAEASIIQCAKAFWTDTVEAGILPIPTAPSNAAERDIALYAMSRRQYHRPPEMLERGMPELTARYAEQKAVLDERKKLLEEAKERLNAIELQLSAYMIGREEDLVIDPDFEVDLECSSLTFYIETWFDVEQKFGVSVPEGSGEWLNLYATYRPDTNELTMEYAISRPDDWENHAYQPTAVEKEMIIKLIGEACRMDCGCGPKEYLDHLRAHEHRTAVAPSNLRGEQHGA